MMCENHSELANLDEVIEEYEPLINVTDDNSRKMGHERRPSMRIEAETGNRCYETRT